MFAEATLCPHCSTPLRDRAFTSCERCAEPASTWTDTIEGDPFWEVRPSVWRAVWAEVKTGVRLYFWPVVWVRNKIGGLFR